jgi:hypothetical protein
MFRQFFFEYQDNPTDGKQIGKKKKGYERDEKRHKKLRAISK